MNLKYLNEWTRKASILTAAVGNQKRMMILSLLDQKERNVSELGALVGLGQSPLSQHLAKLRELGLVSRRRQGQLIYYRLQSDDARAILELLEAICGADTPEKQA